METPISMPIPVPLTGGDLDRADALRRDEAAMEKLREDPSARLLAYREGQPLAIFGPAGAQLALLEPSNAYFNADPDPVFLGLDDGAPRFAVDLTSLDEDLLPILLPAGAKFADQRGVSPELSPREAGMAATARSLLEWRKINGFCPRCGGANRQSQGGWRRDCSACGTQHFPRTDPVVIMLVADRDPDTGEERVLLGRQHGWPPSMRSLLAGFVEPGESIEAAVRRETMEEAGVRVGRVGYLASQPWPFVSSLMVGCYAEALSAELSIDPHELESAEWFAKSRVQNALKGGDPDFMAPRTDAIAFALLRAWAEGKVVAPT